MTLRQAIIAAALAFVTGSSIFALARPKPKVSSAPELGWCVFWPIDHQAFRRMNSGVCTMDEVRSGIVCQASAAFPDEQYCDKVSLLISPELAESLRRPTP